MSALVTSRIVSLGNELSLILSSFGTEEGVYFDAKVYQLVSLIQSTAHPLLSPDLWEELPQPGIWSEAKYSPSLGSSRGTIQGGQLLQKVLVKSWVRGIRYF